MRPIIVVVGTRPEAIKLAPLYQALTREKIPTLLCATFQHSELLAQVFDLFQITPDIRLDVMRENQDLFFLTCTILEKISRVYQEYKPSLVLVQGDTTTTFAAALAAFYLKIPVGHIEAGLRSGNKYSPFPEEINRVFTSTCASFHFAPTALNVANLLREGIPRESIACTGNTAVDALFWIRDRINTKQISICQTLIDQIENCKKNKQQIVLITAHRRESFDGGLERIFSSIKTFAAQHPDVTFFYPFHPNPHVLKAIELSCIRDIPNILLMPPLLYKDLVYLLMACNWVVSDSGGIQEEAISLGKSVIVVREYTERPEGIWEGMLTLAGTDEKSILHEMLNLYAQQKGNHQDSLVYGDGKACSRIVAIIKKLIQPSHSTLNESSALKTACAKTEKIMSRHQ